MKWYRWFLLVALLGLFVSCKNPNAPRYPGEEDTGEDEPRKKGGSLLSDLPVYWA